MSAVFAVSETGSASDMLLDPQYDDVKASEGMEKWFPFTNSFDVQTQDIFKDDEDGDVIEGCDCWNTTEDGREIEVECRCAGHELTSVPDDLPSDVSRITVVHAGLSSINRTTFQPYKRSLTEIVLNDVKQLREIQRHAFEGLHDLRTVYISHAPLLKYISPHVFDLTLPALKILRIVHTGLQNIPNVRQIHHNSILYMVDLESNKIDKVLAESVKLRAESVLLNYNVIKEVEDYAFSEAEIAKLSFKGNRQLEKLGTYAFEGLRSLRELDLSETSIKNLPVRGLNDIEVLYMENTYTVKQFPSIYHFEYLKKASLTYPYHCCAFDFPEAHDPNEYAKHEDFVAHIHAVYCADPGRYKRKANDDFGIVVYSPDNMTHLHHDPDWKALSRSRAPSAEPDGVFHQSTVAVSPRLVQVYCGNVSKQRHKVACHPVPDAFNPCEDIMGNWILRVSVWVIAPAALFGNLAVLVVLLSTTYRITVSKFLICNLAFADLCMGVYLLLIATTDVHSIGVYFNHAIDWQEGIGCKIAGVFTVFSSELSLYTLTVVTLERWYVISHSMHQDRRLELGTAARIMACGWIYSIMMAVLPLFGISSFSATSICLPMKNSVIADTIYLAVILVTNVAAFLTISSCYLKIYVIIRNHNAATSNSDKIVAKRMALLIFTNFACWTPISFFGITALAGYPLIDVTHSKILLVFFYPLNSCANPYLYALLTKQYRRDLTSLLNRCNVSVKKRKRPQNGRIQREDSDVQPPEIVSVNPPRSSSSDSRPRGSPHPLRNSNLKLSAGSDHELTLKRTLDMSMSDPVPVYTHPLDSQV